MKFFLPFVMAPLLLGASENKQSEANFLEVLEKRYKNKNFDCNLFTALKKYSCLSYQAAKAFDEDITSYRFKIMYAIEAMNLTQNIVSSARYSGMKRELKENFDDPGKDVEFCLTNGYGICGNQSRVFRALLKEVGIKSRTVEFYYFKNGTRNSHVAVEAFIEDKWRYFDSTWGGFYVNEHEGPLEIESVKNIIINPGKYKLVENSAQSWRFNYGLAGYDVYEHFKYSPSIIYGFDSGTIYINDILPNDQTINLQSIPNFVGDNIDDGQFEGIRYEFPVLEGKYTFHIKASGIEGCVNESKLCVNDSCVPIAKLSKKENKQTDIAVTDPSSIHILSSNNSCYIVFEEISFTKQM